MAPWRRMPFHSCSGPIQYPGVSWRFTRGIPKRSQNRTNRATLSAASQSIAPALDMGWEATMPAVRPLKRPNPMITLVA